MSKPPLIIHPHDVENDSDYFNQDGKDTGHVESQSQQNYHVLGADSRPVRDSDENGAIALPLYHIKDVSYLANVYVGAPKGQRARVVFDSGSNWLTVKACISMS